jgi:hypothetical protein
MIEKRLMAPSVPRGECHRDGENPDFVPVRQSIQRDLPGAPQEG